MRIKRILIFKFCLFTLLSFSQSKATKSVTKANPSTKIEKVTGVGMLLTKEKIEFGLIKQFSAESRTLEYINNGSEALTIFDISSSCACLNLTFSKESLLPGKSSTILIKHNAEKIGKFQKTLLIKSNATNQNSKVIIVTGEVIDASISGAELTNLSNERVRELKEKENEIIEKNAIKAQQRKTKVVVDSRDGKSYKLDVINDKLWFVEDLKFEGKEHTKSNYSQFKENGLFYKNTNLYTNELCPKGFRLPTKQEFEMLPDSYFINFTDFKGYIDFDGSGFGEERKRQNIPNRDIKSSAYLTSQAEFDDSQVIHRSAYIFSYVYSYNLREYVYERLSYEKRYEIKYFNCRCVEE